MFAEADAFVSLPGGLDTWMRRSRSSPGGSLGCTTPILLCDIAGSAAPLLAAIDAAISLGFAAPRARDLFEVTDGVGPLLERLRSLPRAAACRPTGCSCPCGRQAGRLYAAARSECSSAW